MAGQRLWSGNSRKLAALFLALVAPPAVTLVWLGLQLLQQDRSLLAQRELESRQTAGQAIVRSLEQLLSDADRHVVGGPVPDGAVRFTVSESGLGVEPANRLLWLPAPQRLKEAASAPFAEAETLEFQRNARRAVSSYDELARSPDLGVRAGALLRLARVHRRERKWDSALEAYRRLTLLTNMAIDGIPADLVARTAICSVFEESGRKSELDRESAALESDLLAGRWPLDRPAWELTAGKVEQWTGRGLSVGAERKQASVVADWLWEEWKRHGGSMGPVPRRVVVVEGTPVTLLSQRAGADLAVLALLPSGTGEWIGRAIRGTRIAGTQVKLVADSGETVAGSTSPQGPGALRLPSADTGLPWTLVLTPGDSASEAQAFAQRRRLFAAGLAAIMLLLAGGSYILWRVVQRELAVARLQTDFVSAVSHEFRTPLASLRHITELLDEDDNVPAERRRTFYQALGRNTERLHRLVESLLDFARMEGGRKPYHLEPMDAAELTEQVVADFEKEARPRGFSIDLDVERGADQGLELQADAASLTHALWNLLDNAVKYSPQQHAVRVSVRRHPAGISISVQDHGLGIPERERKEIFGRFVRGEKARELGIKGTGLGLAIVSHIVQAHGGTVEVESEEGAGSTFRLVLPAGT
jgi:signal transduction histidine kinase